MNFFNSQNRHLLISELKKKTFDLVIVGGGITGAGIALDAASRGLNVALVEKGDFASGTSSRSTKLIHGGLRYLKQLELALVAKVGKERAIVHKMAPHLVRPEKMLLPLFSGNIFSKFILSVGLFLYDRLAGVPARDRYQMLKPSEGELLEPLLSGIPIIGAGYYAEYRTDDARLTLETLKTAATFDARCINYVQAQSVVYDSAGKVAGLACKDGLVGDEFQIDAQVVVNATGPWAEKLKNLPQSKKLFLTKGVHIVLAHELVPIKQAIYFNHSDGRMIFLIPRGRATYIGTTDTPHAGSPDEVKVAVEDVEYLISAVNQVFPTLNLSIKGVESSWAGLRPLIFEEGKKASEMSRKDELYFDSSGLVTIAGGKLTGFRKMAEMVVDGVINKFFINKKEELGKAKTKSLKLFGGEFRSYHEVEKFFVELCARAKPFGLVRGDVRELVFCYGTRSSGIVEEYIRGVEGGLMKEEALVQATLGYALKEEMLLKMVDFFNQRTGKLFFHISEIKKDMPIVLRFMAEHFAWDEARKRKELDTLKKAMFDATVVLR
ncbi:glycerol-3-phosphate dehydrogenase/oxidase [Flammeovirgaceae bacterium SG7u.111]|nr:glycerol-3-phosphate dehydrogenase/oxidase [Flammeovirgaceae bacterium SG7u.132]WPO34004.1 glycerol-3-phosphate dehydrogenase/oxidase [Flammeovirgaceae bacterium SG7u.111]